MSAQVRERPDTPSLNNDSDLTNNPFNEPINRSRRVPGSKWRTRASLFGIPLVCVAYGRDERGRPIVAKGFVAIGQFAIGGLVIAQFGCGLLCIAQFAVGLAAFGQLALSPLVGFGQLAVGTFAVGQFVIGKFARGQYGWAEYLWSPDRVDMEAVAMFETIVWLVQQDIAIIWENVKDAFALMF